VPGNGWPPPTLADTDSQVLCLPDRHVELDEAALACANVHALEAL
jgi:hypothetical protein